MWQLRRACTHSVVVTTRLARVTRRRTITQQQPLSLMHSEAKPGTAGTSSSSSMAGECEAVATSSDDRRKGPRGGSDGSTPGGQGGTGARSASASASGASARDSTKPHDDSIFTMRAIGVVRSPFKQKFGIPRQPGLAPAAVATVELQPPFNNVDAVRGLEGWSHVWITFVFHGIPEQQVAPDSYKATVHPPRGGEKYGVWATRTTHRPNRLGLSLCELVGVDTTHGGVRLRVAGADLLDGTPVLDIKPYLPYCESLPHARAGFAPMAPPVVPVEWTPTAVAGLATSAHPELRELAEQVLAQDPRPTWQRRDEESGRSSGASGKTYCLHLADSSLFWRYVRSEECSTASGSSGETADVNTSPGADVDSAARGVQGRDDGHSSGGRATAAPAVVTPGRIVVDECKLLQGVQTTSGQPPRANVNRASDTLSRGSARSEEATTKLDSERDGDGDVAAVALTRANRREGALSDAKEAQQLRQRLKQLEDEVKMVQNLLETITL